MPVIHLNPVLANELAKTISNLTKEHLNKRPEVTVVTISFVPKNLWFVNSQSLDELKMNSFHLNVTISDSTNLKDHKSSYIQAVHDALSARLGSIHPVSYTSIQELKADAYGYEGLTIEYKIIASKIKSL
jgi:4-oxalocrotonate tautomerase